MGFLLTLSRIYLPRSVRRNRLERLFRVTAAAFQCPLPPPEASSFARYLLQYAAFTAENAEKALRQGRENMVKASLYSGASVSVRTSGEISSITLWVRLAGLRGYL